MIRINNKQADERIEEGEYMALNLKPETMSISATKQEIQEHVLKMDLKAGQIYYLKIVDDMAGGAFEFHEVDSITALQEIEKTGLIGTNEESPENIITEFVSSDSEADSVIKANETATMTEAQIDAMIEQKLAEKSSTTAVVPVVGDVEPSSNSVPVIAPIGNTTKASVSQMDEILKAYEMKEKGILSDTEFKAIKANILNK